MKKQRQKSVRVALVGFGFAGRSFHAPLISATPGLALSVISTRLQGDSAAALYPNAQRVADALEAVRHPEVDLVVIASPNGSHAPLAEAALRAGKHVVVDKPFTLTLREARALAASATQCDRLLSVFQNRRWDSDFLGIERAIADGAVGDIVEFRSEISRFRPQIRDRWRERAGAGSGLWYDLGPHLADQAILLFGPPDTVSADLQILRRDGSAVDWFQVVLGYAGKRIILSSSMLAADAAPRFLVRGTKGSLQKRGGDVQEAQLIAGGRPGGAGWGRDPDPILWVDGNSAAAEIAVPAGNYLNFYMAMANAIAGAGTVPVTPAQACTVMAVLEAGLSSAQSGQRVAPDYTAAERATWGELGTIQSGFVGLLV